MIRRLLAAATHFDAQLSKRLFARKLVFRRETTHLPINLAYARADDRRWRRDR
jgi:hypothetical protein